MKKIVIFASGKGSNARKIIEHFEENTQVQIAAILTNRKKAGVLELSGKYDIPNLVFSREDFYNSEKVLNFISKLNADLIVLAGFLWLIPAYLINAYPQKIVNIHPSLLPKFGGKGMYGMNVHKAVKESKEATSGITIHFVNQEFDEGKIIYQAGIELDPKWSAEEIASQVLQLEHFHLPREIEKILQDKN